MITTFNLKRLTHLQRKYNQRERSRNLIISAPTNSGKTLIGYHCLIKSLNNNGRALLLEPLRALAQEKFDELSLSFDQIKRISISTGDYRLLGENFNDSAPESELVVATPERLEAIFRNSKSKSWIEQIGCVVIDEAHLIADRYRGATLEYLITALKCLPTKPRIVLLSATIGNVDKLKQWLEPCEVVSVTERCPALHKHVLEVPEGADSKQQVIEWARDICEQDPNNQALIFVYQTRATESLAKELTQALGELAGKEGVLPYHSKLSSTVRSKHKDAFTSGQSRIVVTTSALAMGINLPCTHTLVRDLTYPGARNPDVGDLLQMMGRAGRGTTEGHAYVLCRSSDDWSPEELQQALEEERLPEFKSVFEPEQDWHNQHDDTLATTQVASYLSRRGGDGAKSEEIKHFFKQSLGGQYLADSVDSALFWLERHLLVWDDFDTYRLTVLGQKAARSVLPLPLAYGYTNLLRDLMALDDSDETLKSWQPLDHLISLSLLYDRTPSLRNFSSKLFELVNAAMETSTAKKEQVPLLFKAWLRGEKDHSKAIEVFGSLGLSPPKPGKTGEEWARKKGYQAALAALVLDARGHGKALSVIEKQFGIKNFDGIEERWRDDLMWLLAGIAKLLDIRVFYYHLKEDCEANVERVKRVKGILKAKQMQVYHLMEQLKYCSALGPLLKDMQRANRGKAGVGIQTIRNLEEAGVDSMAKLAKLKREDLVKMGVRRDIAERIASYIRRRRL